ncbi:unnamed protein product [Lactuca saligna]|uniref:Uncharacterized protein n=1 Tax=Lactuca saligna TaxID=75948 RepID=A0AA36E0J5_LACSI|nr:unnamed protein product [Lactuca saligna]
MFYKKTVEIRKSKGLGRCIAPNLYLLHSLIVIPLISKHHRRHVSVKKKKKNEGFIGRHHLLLFFLPATPPLSLSFIIRRSTILCVSLFVCIFNRPRRLFRSLFVHYSFVPGFIGQFGLPSSSINKKSIDLFPLISRFKHCTKGRQIETKASIKRR